MRKAFMSILVVNLLAGCNTPDSEARSSFSNYVYRCEPGTLRFSRIDRGEQIVFEATCKAVRT